MKSRDAKLTYLKEVVKSNLTSDPMGRYDYIWDPQHEQVMGFKTCQNQTNVSETMLRSNPKLKHIAFMNNCYFMAFDSSLMLDGVHDPWAWTGVKKPSLNNCLTTTISHDDRKPESIDRPERYLGKKGDLLDAFEGYILNHDEMVGAYKFNIIKYVTRFVEKNGIEDLDKAEVYIKRLKKFLQEEDK